MALSSQSRQIMFRFFDKYKFFFLLSFLLGMAAAVFNGVGTTLIIPLLLVFLDPKFMNEFEGAPPVLQKLVSVFDGIPDNFKIIAIFGVVLTSIILKNVIGYVNGLVGAHIGRSIVNGMRLEGMEILFGVDLDFFAKHKIGDITQRLGGEIMRMASTVTIYFGLISQIINMGVMLALLIALSWQLTLISSFLLALIALSNQYFINRAKKFGRILSESSRKYSNKLFDILTGIRLIKTVGSEPYEYGAIETTIREREKAQFDNQANSMLIGPINEIASILAVLVMVFVGRYIFASQIKSLSAILLTYLFLLFRFLPSISGLNNTRSKLANVSYSVDIASDFLRRDNKPFMTNGYKDYTPLEQGIGFESVTFSYPERPKKILKQIDIWIPKGKTTALVGASGAGKSTIADLLPRFYDPTEGKITFDGTNIKEFDLRQLRQAMGIVSQDTFLFNKSVSYNITYGAEHITEEEVIQAAKRANAYEFISKLPEGFDTEIGDRGVMLSGGQRQRLAIARAMVRNPDILILDEATSALDTVSERLVQQAIDEICRDRTTLVIAHRLSTIRRAHQIIVLDKGKIVEVGNHEELLKKDGYYARLHFMQFASQEKEQINDNNQGTELEFYKQLETQLSYETRSRLNAMLGSLRLMADGLIDNPEEQQELIEESYDSALDLFNLIESLEEKTAKSTSEN